MKIDLNRKDLAKLVGGNWPPLEDISMLEKRGLGRYTGGFHDRWDWDITALEKLSEQELYDMYLKYNKN